MSASSVVANFFFFCVRKLTHPSACSLLLRLLVPYILVRLNQLLKRGEFGGGGPPAPRDINHEGHSSLLVVRKLRPQTLGLPGTQTGQCSGEATRRNCLWALFETEGYSAIGQHVHCPPQSLISFGRVFLERRPIPLRAANLLSWCIDSICHEPLCTMPRDYHSSSLRDSRRELQLAIPTDQQAL